MMIAWKSWVMLICAETKLLWGLLPAPGCRASGTNHNLRCAGGSVNGTFGTYWSFWGFKNKEGSFGHFLKKGTSSIQLVSALPHGCFALDLIKTLSLICLCLGQTSLWVFCSGSSLPRWPWTMSGRTVGIFFFVSVNDSSRSCRNPKNTQHTESGALPTEQDHNVAVAWGFTECGGFHSLGPSQVDWFLSELALKEMNSYQWLWNLRQSENQLTTVWPRSHGVRFSDV